MPLKPHKALLPLACLYGAAVALRNRLFDCGWLRERRFPLPVVGVGNLTVGGTGKTPHIEYLLRLLLPLGQVAVLSRGYRRQSEGFVCATRETPVAEVGDEPWQMKQKFPRAVVAVDANRCRGIERLQESVEGLKAVLLDDSFQHRYVKPGINILLVDSRRPVWDDRMLPAGYLREPAAGKRRADVVILTKCPPDMPEAEADRLRTRLQPLPHQQVFFTTLAYGQLRPLFGSDATERPLSCLQGHTAVLLTGIAAPQPLAEEVGRWARVVPLTFGDHHDFSPADLHLLAETCRRADRPAVVTTEKDAARLSSLSGYYPEELRKCTYVLPVEVRFLYGDDKKFNKIITEYVEPHPTNG
jgi:tetraacyldisaccharide 4'-kinase